MSTILGGFEELVYTSDGIGKSDPTFTSRGVMSRVNPVLDPGNINIEGTGRRGLYDILLGMREPVFTADMLFTDPTFISVFQTGVAEIPWLHLRVPGTPDAGLTFEKVKLNTLSVEGRHNEAISATIEFWAQNIVALAAPAAWPTAVTTPKRWSDSSLTIATILETEWWSWRYEVNNNLQRLGNVASGATRDIKARNRSVTGMIVKDLSSFTDWTTLMNTTAEMAKFNITIAIGATTFLNSNCRWGRIEAPSGPTDLLAKRFPFTALDVT